MTHKERINRLFQKLSIDRIPCFSGMSTVTLVGLKKYNLKFSEIHLDSDKMAKAAYSTYELFDFESVVVPFDMGIEAEVLGVELNFYQDSEDPIYPTVRDRYIEDVDEIIIPKDLEKQKRIPVVLDAIKKLKEMVKDKVAIGTYILGPYTLAGQIIDLNQLFIMSFKEKDKVKKILEKLTDFLILICEIYSSSEPDYITIREGGASVLSPKDFKEMIMPYLVKLLDKIKLPKVLAISGDTDKIVEYMAECGANAISVDQKNHIKKSREKIKKDVLLFGNYDPYNTLCKMENPEVEETIKKIIDAKVDAVWPGSDFWPDIKEDNLKTLIKTAREYGRREK